ncbi:hypothetical protein [uncultured Corynebacterium sp.]|uniref:hypothetical protein n=1 Tax=uncultured Corynebacterium sp. TaxID=159447 RepID=UPI00261D4538|nr:hypothetical protein [uncultured Corynebacterium sp.]
MKKLVVACGMAALALSHTAATAAEPTVVDQGDAIVVGGSACTVGFNLGASSYTAAHCGESGDRVRLLLADGTLTPPTGTLTISAASEGTTNDWARIDWDAGVEVGPNEYSGDGAVALDAVRPGEQVCTYGQATRATTCGVFHARVGNSFLVDIAPGKAGDSGGPVWIPGRGFLGVHSATVSGRNNLNGEEKTMLLGATTADGDDIADALSDAFLDYFDVTPAFAGAPKPPPTAAGGVIPEDSAPQESDSWYMAALIGVVALLTVVINLIL